MSFREEERPDFTGPICFHCSKEIDIACETVIDAVGETFCSTLCAALVVRFDHDENCGKHDACVPEIMHTFPRADGIYYRGGVA